MLKNKPQAVFSTSTSIDALSSQTQECHLCQLADVCVFVYSQASQACFFLTLEISCLGSANIISICSSTETDRTSDLLRAQARAFKYEVYLISKCTYMLLYRNIFYQQCAKNTYIPLNGNKQTATFKMEIEAKLQRLIRSAVALFSSPQVTFSTADGLAWFLPGRCLSPFLSGHGSRLAGSSEIFSDELIRLAWIGPTL